MRRILTRQRESSVYVHVWSGNRIMCWCTRQCVYCVHVVMKATPIQMQLRPQATPTFSILHAENNIENVGVAWGRGYTNVHASRSSYSHGTIVLYFDNHNTYMYTVTLSTLFSVVYFPSSISSISFLIAAQGESERERLTYLMYVRIKHKTTVAIKREK